MIILFLFKYDLFYFEIVENIFFIKIYFLLSEFEWREGCFLNNIDIFFFIGV